MNAEEKYNRAVAAMTADIEGFEVRYKPDWWHQRLTTKIMFWADYMAFTTTFTPKVYFSSREYVQRHWPWQTMEHEWVHLKDNNTFYGLMPWMPKFVNRFLCAVGYIFPQVLAVGALGAFGAFAFPPMLFCLGFLLFLLPLPAPLRTWTEFRGYRRSLELMSERSREDGLERAVHHFSSSSYYFMWPFKNSVRRQLQKPSPYKDMMDGIYD